MVELRKVLLQIGERQPWLIIILQTIQEQIQEIDKIVIGKTAEAEGEEHSSRRNNNNSNSNSNSNSNKSPLDLKEGQEQ